MNPRDQERADFQQNPHHYQEPRQHPPQENIHIYQTQPEEKSGRGLFGNAVLIFGIGAILIIGFFILQSLGVISNELGQQSDQLQQQTNMLGQIEIAINDLVDTVKEMGSK